MTYEQFYKMLAIDISEKLDEAYRLSLDTLSQRQAYKMYGKGNVMRWKERGELKPFSVRPGKIKYKVEDLEKLHNRFQDYF